MTKTMAEVLAEHIVITDGLYEPSGWCATCGNLDHGDQEEHQAAELTAAGFGLVADAKAEALEEAADWLDPEGDGRGSISGWLRERAKTARLP